MHLLESQSTQAGQAIGKPEIYPKFFPLPITNPYIVFSPQSKDAKIYDMWLDVLNIIAPILDKNNINIIQTGAANEKPYPHCIHLMGQTTINQVAYIVQKSIGVLSVDTFVHHISDFMGIKSVILVSNNFSNNVRGYFCPDNQMVLEPPREKDERPSFAVQEIPKTINKIKPEDIAAAVFKMLNIDFHNSYEQIYVGDVYLQTKMLEMVPDNLINPQGLGVDSLIVRMDFLFSEDLLAKQLQICPCSILTNRPISLDLIKNFKPRIKELVYLIDSEEHSKPDFVKAVSSLGIPFRVLSTLPQDKINELKLDWMELAIIHKKIEFSFDNLKYPLEDKDKLYFKSNKITLARQKIYLSYSHYLADLAASNFDEVMPIIDNISFFQELEHFRVLKAVETQ